MEQFNEFWRQWIFTGLGAIVSGLCVYLWNKFKKGADLYSEHSKEEFLKDSLNEVLPKFLNNVCEHMKIDDLLSDKQISSIVDYAYNEIIKNINSSEELKYLLSDLYEEDGNIYLNQLISKESGEKVTRIISCEIMNSIDELLDSKKESKAIVDKSLSLIDIKSLLKNLQKTVGSKTIDDILTEEEDKSYEG